MKFDTQLLDNILKDYPYLVCEDLRQEEELSKYADTLPEISAISLICSDEQPLETIEVAEGICIDALAHIVFSEENSKLFFPWLFLAHGAWQPNTRIVRHHRLRGGFTIPHQFDVLTKAQDIEIESIEGLRYATAVKLDEATLPMALKIIRREKTSSFILLSDVDRDWSGQTKQLFEVTFPDNINGPQTRISWPSLIISLCPQNQLLIKANGSKDDGELSLRIIGLTPIVRSLRL
jgi:hypothetical protein